MEIIVCYGCQIEITRYITHTRLSEPEFCEACYKKYYPWEKEYEENLEDIYNDE